MMSKTHASIVDKERAAAAEANLVLLVGHVQDLRDRGTLPKALAFGHIARALTWLAESRVQASHRSGELAELSEDIKAIEKAHGLGPKDFWPNGDGPPEWQALNDQYSQVAIEITAEFMREHGEDKMAEIMLADLERFDRLCAVDRRARYDA